MDEELLIAVLQQWQDYNERLAELCTDMTTFLRNNRDVARFMQMSMLVCTVSVDLEQTYNNGKVPVVTPDVTSLCASDGTFALMLDKAKEMADNAKNK